MVSVTKTCHHLALQWAHLQRSQIFCLHRSHVNVELHCYDPPNFSHLPYSFSPAPTLVSFDLKPTTRPAIPQWTSPSQVVMTQSPSPAMSIYPSLDLPTIVPDVPLIPWGTHQQEHSSMEQFTEPPIAEQPDLDIPIEDAPTVYYLPDVPDGPIHTLHPERLPAEPWREHYAKPSPPVSRKHSRSPTSPESAPIRQCTSCEGSYHSITPSALLPIVGTLPQSQGHQSTLSEGSADNPSSTQSSTDNVDSDMALNWVSIKPTTIKGSCLR